MTDPHNCGSCGHDCQGGACSGGACQPFALATGQNIAYPPEEMLAVDASSIYWPVVNGTTQVMKCSVGGCGGVPTVVASDSHTDVRSIATDGAMVYWGYRSGDPNPSNTGQILRAPVGGGTPAVFASGFFANVIRFQGANVYWSFGRSINSSGGGVLTAPIAGGSPTLLAGDSIAASPREPYAIAVDANNVYWTDWGNGNPAAVGSVPIGGGATVTLATGQSTPTDIAVDATSIYWVGVGLQKMPLAGGAPVTLASGVGGIAVDATGVYGLSAAGLVRVPLAGGTPITLVAGAQSDGPVVLDCTGIYWTTATSGTYSVMKLPR